MLTIGGGVVGPEKTIWIAMLLVRKSGAHASAICLAELQKNIRMGSAAKAAVAVRAMPAEVKRMRRMSVTKGKEVVGLIDTAVCVTHPFLCTL